MIDTDCCQSGCDWFDTKRNRNCRLLGRYAELCIGYKQCLSYSKKETTEINNPFDYQVDGSHYKKEGLMDVTEWCMRHDVPLAEFNVIKYTFRHKKKNGIIDLRKAKHYLEFIAYIKYGENL